jgi:hypothetical protein
VHALREGLARAAAAPAVLAGAVAVLVWLSGPSDTRNVVAGFLLWAFLSGGILDRYARARPLRACGFFGACGAHFGAMVRLALLAVLLTAAIHGALASRVSDPAIRTIAIVLLSAVAVLTLYAQVRLVVEDRRSALGAMLAALRFARRNLISVVLFVVYCLLMTVAGWILAALAPQAPGASTLWLLFLLRAVVLCYLVLSLYASAIVLFQSRLAHAGYTAAPPIEWPDSPAAEAIANAAPFAP